MIRTDRSCRVPRWAQVRAILLAAIFAGAAGCAVGPDYHRPVVVPVQGYSPEALPSDTVRADASAGGVQHVGAASGIAGDWWTLFASPGLNALIEEALHASPTLDAARAALRQAQETVAAQRGAYFPSLQANYTGQRSKASGNTAGATAPGPQGNGTDIAPPAPAQPVTYSFHTAELTVGFVPDVFGLNRRQVESLQAQADDARFELEAARVTLATNVVAAAIAEAATRAQIEAVQSIIEANRRALGVLEQQLKTGYAGRLDLAAQQSALAQVLQLLPPLTQQLQQTRDLLRALTGQGPDHELLQTFELGVFTLPSDLPVSIPAQLLEQRPDVRAAEAQAHAATALIGVAVANRLPQFSITGDVGGNASQLGQIFQGAGTFWDLVGNASLPLFEGGTLLHRQRAAEQACRVAQAQYRAVVIAAFENVADTLHALYADAESAQAAEASERAAQVAWQLSQRQFDAGYLGYLPLAAALQIYRQAQISRIQAQASRLSDTAALFQALGGGWWNRHD